MAKRGLDLELCCRSAVFLLRVHFAQIVAARALLTEVSELQQVLRGAVGDYRGMLGTNLAGIRFLSRAEADRKLAFVGMGSGLDDEPPSSALGQGKRKKKKSSKSREVGGTNIASNDRKVGIVGGDSHNKKRKVSK